MLRTIVVLIALVLAVLFLPVWLQLLLLLAAVWVVPYRLAVLVPAVLVDVLYSPTAHLSIDSFKVTLIVSVFILVRWLLLTQTRFASLVSIQVSNDSYGMEA